MVRRAWWLKGGTEGDSDVPGVPRLPGVGTVAQAPNLRRSPSRLHRLLPLPHITLSPQRGVGLGAPVPRLSSAFLVALKGPPCPHVGPSTAPPLPRPSQAQRAARAPPEATVTADLSGRPAGEGSSPAAASTPAQSCVSSRADRPGPRSPHARKMFHPKEHEQRKEK